MTEHIINKIRKKLAPGYSLVQVQPGAGLGVYEVRDAKGAPLFDESGAPIRFADKGGNYNKVTASLRRLGAIPPPKPRNPTPRAAAVSRSKTETNPILMAGEILRDPQATPRERKMASSFLETMKRLEEVGKLAKKLGQALKERSDT